MAASSLKLSQALSGALLKVGQGRAIHQRYASRLAQLGLIQKDMFSDRLTLTADGRQQLGLTDGEEV